MDLKIGGEFKKLIYIFYNKRKLGCELLRLKRKKKEEFIKKLLMSVMSGCPEYI